MHLKAIPEELATFASSKWALMGGAALLAGVGLYYVHVRASNAASSPDTTGSTAPVSIYTSPAPYSLGGIQDTTQGGGFVGGSTTPPVSTDTTNTTGTQTTANNPVPVQTVIYQNPAALTSPTMEFPQPAGIDPATAELLRQQDEKLNMDYQTNLLNLQLQSEILQANTYVQLATLHSSDYQSAAALAMAFTGSNNDVGMGDIKDSSGNDVLSYAFGQAAVGTNSKGNPDTTANVVLNNQVSSNLFGQFFQTTHPSRFTGQTTGDTLTPMPTANDPYQGYLPPIIYAPPAIQTSFQSTTPSYAVSPSGQVTLTAQPVSVQQIPIPQVQQQQPPQQPTQASLYTPSPTTQIPPDVQANINNTLVAAYSNTTGIASTGSGGRAPPRPIAL